jgi:hypothetical protein
MTIAAEGQPRSAGRTATAVQSLSPGYFPFVMATSIISTATFLLGPSWLSGVLLVIASAGLAVLSVALVIQLAHFRPSLAADFRDPGKVAHLAFMEPLSRFMLWVAMAAWVAVAAALVARIPARGRMGKKVNSR